MLNPVYAKSFERELKLAVRRGKDPEKVKAVVNLLCAQAPLPAALRDHALKGKYSGFRDCHVEPDLILIYRVVQQQLQLLCVHLGTHSDLFKK